MLTIHKFELPLGISSTKFELPKYAKPLTAQIQNGKLMVWIELDTNKVKEINHFHVCGTGQELKPFNFLRYVATVQDNSYVWHIYWEPK